MLTIYLIRHGEYDGNLQDDRLTGRSDLRPLNPIGVVQARNTAMCFEDKKIDAVYSSPVPRALQTAQIISRKIGHTPIVEEKIAEINYGEIEGKKFTEIHKWFKEKYKNVDITKFDRFTTSLPSGESFGDLFKRVKIFFDFLVKQNEKGIHKSYIVVTHKASIHALINMLNKEDKYAIFNNYDEKYPLSNASRTEINVDDNGNIEISSIGETHSPPPKIVSDWLEKNFQGSSDYYLYITFGSDYVVSFKYKDELLNAKFYSKQYETLAIKTKKITDYLKNTEVPAKKTVSVHETNIESHPVVVISEHLVSEKKSNFGLRHDKKLAESAATVLKNLHAVTWTPEVSEYWNDIQYHVKVHSLQTWQKYIQSIFKMRRDEVKNARKKRFLDSKLDALEKWFNSKFQSLKKKDLALLHGDFYPSNFNMKDGKVQTVYDWDWATIGHTMWDLGMARERAEYYHYGGLVEHLEKFYGVSDKEKKWIYFYALLEFIGSYANDVIQQSPNRYLKKE